MKLSRLRGISIGLSAALIAATPLAAQEAPGDKLPELEQEIQKRTESQKQLRKRVSILNREIGGLSQELIDTASAIQAQEERVGTLEERVGILSLREQDKRRDLRKRSSQLANTLAALERLARRPQAAVFSDSVQTIDMVRSAALLRSVVPALKEQAAMLGADLKDLRSTRDQLETEKALLRAERDSLALKRRDLNALVEQKRGEERRLAGEVEREEEALEALAREAADLRALIAKLEEQERLAELGEAPRELPKRGLPFSEVRGALPLPVRGTIVHLFNQINDLGLAEKGLRIVARAQAQVIAPYDGKVLYSGPFRTYGELLIIAHGEGYHTLLAGMERIDARVGQWLYAGEPVGQMGTDSEPVLYMELRRRGQPVDPLVWIAESERKVSG